MIMCMYVTMQIIERKKSVDCMIWVWCCLFQNRLPVWILIRYLLAVAVKLYMSGVQKKYIQHWIGSLNLQRHKWNSIKALVSMCFLFSCSYHFIRLSMPAMAYFYVHNIILSTWDQIQSCWRGVNSLARFFKIETWPKKR